MQVTTCDSHGNLGVDVIERPRQKWPDGPCYIAGPMRNVEQFGFPAFFDAEQILKAEHAEVGYNPARHDHQLGFEFWRWKGTETIEETGFDYRPYMEKGLDYIRTKAAWVCVLPGWETSQGSKAEIAAAMFRSLPVLSFPSGEPVPCAVIHSEKEGVVAVEVVGATVDPCKSTTPFDYTQDDLPEEETAQPILEPGQLCTQASAIVAGGRRKSYGDPEDNFARIAILHEAWDRVLATVPPGSVSGTVNVAVRNILQKLARIAETPTHTDSWRDVAGYADCGARCAGCDPTK